jgi:hypothetical protein
VFSMLVVLSRCPCLVLAVLSRLSCHGCPFFIIHSTCPVPSFLTILFFLSCHGCPATLLPCPNCHPAGLSHLSFPDCLSQHACPPVFQSTLSCPCCHVLIVLSLLRLSCPSCPVRAALSFLLCSAHPVLSVLTWLTCPGLSVRSTSLD